MVRVKAHTRKTKNGKTVKVRAHQRDKLPRRLEKVGEGRIDQPLDFEVKYSARPLMAYVGSRPATDLDSATSAELLAEVITADGRKGELVFWVRNIDKGRGNYELGDITFSPTEGRFAKVEIMTIMSNAAIKIMQDPTSSSTFEISKIIRQARPQTLKRTVGWEQNVEWEDVGQIPLEAISYIQKQLIEGEGGTSG